MEESFLEKYPIVAIIIALVVIIAGSIIAITMTQRGLIGEKTTSLQLPEKQSEDTSPPVLPEETGTSTPSFPSFPG